MLKHGLLVGLLALVAWPAVSAATAVDPPTAQAALASCDDYDNQAKAQRAKDTRDADGDGVYCVIYSG
jgi:hypothetical protein